MYPLQSNFGDFTQLICGVTLAYTCRKCGSAGLLTMYVKNWSCVSWAPLPCSFRFYFVWFKSLLDTDHLTLDCYDNDGYNHMW